MATIDEYLRALADLEGSDLHLKAGRPPLIRLGGELKESSFPVLSKNELSALLHAFLTDSQKKKFTEMKELDFSYVLEGLARFRGNIFYQMGSMGAVFRKIPFDILNIDQLKLPEILKELIKKKQGIILVTGPTGSGKSTTLAAMINEVNETRHEHIVTIEDPVEFVHKDKKCTINQRQVGDDTHSFSEALKRAMRQDPDIILVGEMRDPETISIAMSAAETGHLVFSTLHTLDAKQTIDRIIDSFPPEQHHQIRMQLSMTLQAVISQRLIKTMDGKGRLAINEIMISTPTIRKLIEEGKTGQIDRVIADSQSLFQMQTQNQHLLKYVQEGKIDSESALQISNNPNDLRIMFQTKGGQNQPAPAPNQGASPVTPRPPMKPTNGLGKRP